MKAGEEFVGIPSTVRILCHAERFSSTGEKDDSGVGEVAMWLGMTAYTENCFLPFTKTSPQQLMAAAQFNWRVSGVAH